MSKIYEVFGNDPHRMTKSLMEAADVTSRIQPGAKIALKPNLVRAGIPEEGATTHAGVLSGCIEYLQENGFTEISVIESSWVGGDTERSRKVCGYDQVCEQYGVPFYDLKKDRTVSVKTPLRMMEISARALAADFLIDLPVLKGHCQTRMTCALKNLKGCLPDHEKRRFHSEGLHQPIAALSTALKPALVIVDSICGDLDFEDGGNPVYTNRMMLGTDPVQIDAYGCRLMGLDVKDVPYIGMAEEWGVGSVEVGEGDVVRLNEPAESQEYPPASGRVQRLVQNVHADSACSACYASLIRALYIAEREGLYIQDSLMIGQGYQGKKIEGIGIGKCCLGAQKCVKGCPPSADAILRAFRE